MILSLYGCYSSGFGHRFYETYEEAPETQDCNVIWTYSLDNANYKLQKLPPVKFLGKSSFSTTLYYSSYDARNDCMLAGGDYIIVVDKGLVYTKTYKSYYSYNYGSSQYFSYSYIVPITQTYKYYGYSYFVYKKK